MSSIQRVSFKSDSNLLKQSALKPDGVTQSQVIAPVVSEPKPVIKQSGNAVAYITSALAAVSLGITGVFAVKHGKLNKQINKMSKDTQSLVSDLSAKVTKEAKEITENLNKKVEAGLQTANEKISDLGKWQDGQIEGVRKDLSARISEHVTFFKAAGMADIPLRPVEVNGMQLELATVLNGYGKNTQALEKNLQAESAKRIFSIMDRSKLAVPDDVMIRIPTSEYAGLTKTGGMAIVPKEVIANLGGIINNKQGARIIVDTPMYLGQVEENAYYSLVRRSDGMFDYLSTKAKKPLAQVEKIDTMQLPIYTDKGRTTEFVDIYKAKDLKQIVDFDLLQPWLDKNVSENLSKSIKNNTPFEFKNNILELTFDPEKGITEPIATIKYDAILYKHDKFRMDGPVLEGKAKTIYNNLTHEAGETERFAYFDKFFYEHLIRNAESSSDKLRADLVIGNDWQTGGISAMMKLLTQAKKAFGLDPQVADKLYNTPVMTIVHNAGLAGNVWHSQPKLLNVMFGEHSAMIAQNAWMPKQVKLSKEGMNGLFHGNNLNPQTMAASYSDTLIPVSKGYGNEMALNSGFGGANHDIFRMRARVGEYSDIEHLKYVARMNELDPSLISKENMAYRPITNGCDRVNNMLTETVAKNIEEAIGLKKGSLRLRQAGESVVDWHNHNKEVYLNKVIQECDMARKGVANPMNIELAEMTNLQGVTKDTMVVSTAGRIADQKGLDIFAESIEEFLSTYKGDNPPVFYAQGVGEKVFIDKLLDVKRSVAQKYGTNAADRIVFARLFSEPGRYDGCKLMSDFTVMSSWFEPCGLVHKEIAAFSGAIPIVNKVGGLTDGLKDGINAIFAKFKNKYDGYDEAIKFNRVNFADALKRAHELFNDKTRFSNVLQNSFETDHSWLKVGGPIEEYAKLFVDYKVFKPEVLQHS